MIIPEDLWQAIGKMPIRTWIQQVENFGTAVWGSDLKCLAWPYFLMPFEGYDSDQCRSVAEELDQLLGRPNWALVGPFYFFNNEADMITAKLCISHFADHDTT